MRETLDLVARNLTFIQNKEIKKNHVWNLIQTKSQKKSRWNDTGQLKTMNLKRLGLINTKTKNSCMIETEMWRDSDSDIENKYKQEPIWRTDKLSTSTHVHMCTLLNYCWAEHK